MSPPDRDATVAAVELGIDAVTARAIGAPTEAATPCPAWCVHDLVRHLEAIAGAYLLWTGSAVGGRIARMRLGDDLGHYNQLMLERLPRLTVADHVRRFRELASDHARLARVTWSMPMLTSPDGIVIDVGRHAGVVAVEWHVHAWDLARAGGATHEPDGATLDVLTAAWDDTLAGLTGAQRDPAGGAWTSVLLATGRTP